MKGFVCGTAAAAFARCRIEVRDVALAVALHLTQQDLKPYGLTQVRAMRKCLLAEYDLVCR